MNNVAMRPKAVFSDAESQRLADRLRQSVRGEVRFDSGTRALYSADASNYRQVPVGVVVPQTAEDIVQAVRVCREFGAPILPRGGGTSMCGQAVNYAVGNWGRFPGTQLQQNKGQSGSVTLPP